MLSSRSPQGERGLKSNRDAIGGFEIASLPSGGAWVEIKLSLGVDAMVRSRSPQGERGLK